MSLHIAFFVDYHITTTLGGTQTSMMAQKQGLEQLGHTVTIFCPQSVEQVPAEDWIVEVPIAPLIRFNGIPIVLITRSNEQFIENAIKTRGPFDCFHAQSNMGLGILAANVAKKLSIPFVQTMHGRDDILLEKNLPFPFFSSWLAEKIHSKYVPHVQHAAGPVMGWTARHVWDIMINQVLWAENVVIPTKHFREEFIKRGVTIPIKVISNGLSSELLKTISPVIRSGEQRPLKLMWCSRMSQEKNPLIAIDAVKDVKKVHLYMYGDGPSLAATRIYIKNHGVKNVTLMGGVSQDKVLTDMMLYDVLIFTSHGFDNQPMVLLEATATGLPVIYSDPNMKESLPAEGSMLVRTSSVDAFKDALQTLLNHPEKIKTMSKAMIAARPSLVQTAHSAKMVTFYQSLIEHRPAAAKR